MKITAVVGFKEWGKAMRGDTGSTDSITTVKERFSE